MKLLCRETRILVALASILFLAGDQPKQLPWLDNLNEAYTQAQRRGEPVLVRFGSESCPWCRKLDAEIAKPEVQQALGKWTLVALDAEKADKEAKALGVGPIPALRVLTSRGRLVASHAGYLPADELIAWLKKYRDAAASVPAAELTDSGPPSAAAVIKVVRELQQRDAIAREAAVRRLLPHPDVAAVAVAEAFAEGSLQTRLATLELLQPWKAPVQEIDPWNPETITAARLEALQKWAAKGDKAAPEMPKQLPPTDLATAKAEIARVLQGSDAEAAASRERLARLGTALLPEVYAQLKAAETDRAREMLTALRYRLVATDSLALNWPGGLERLAATATAIRHQAAQELARRATATDEALLLELFSDPDALVREISLRALYEIAGLRATEALTRLLKDPEPNVRAAVLKQMAEQPSAAMVATMAQFVKDEKDPDLVVHAVRVLKGTRNKPSMNCLKDLLAHESWRVRAEAAEALGKYVENRYMGSGNDEMSADVYAAMIDLLPDPDGFVVARALQTLKRANLATAVEPVAAVTEKHPDLAAEVVEVLSAINTARGKVLPHLRKFCAHPQADVRAAAISGLSNADAEGSHKELQAALQDKESQVRRAAATAFFHRLAAHRPNANDGMDGVEFEGPPPPPALSQGPIAAVPQKQPEAEASPKPADPPQPEASNKRSENEEAAKANKDRDSKLEEWRAGKKRPAWINETASLLPRLLTAQSPEERLAGALPLVALDRDDKALPVLLAVAKSEPRLQGEAAAVLCWLPWAKRIEVFHQLLSMHPHAEQLADIIRDMAQCQDKRALEPLWALTADDKLPVEAANALLGGFNQLYFGQRYYDRNSVSAKTKKNTSAAVKPRAETGPEWQRVLALGLLLSVSLDEAGEAAQKVMADAKAGPALRRDAFQTLLMTHTKSESRRTALAALKNDEPLIRETALTLLTQGAHSLQQLRDGQLYVYFANDELFAMAQMYQGGGQPVVPEAPKGLQPEMLKPLLRDANPRTSAQAGYLLALLHDPDGLEPLVRYWRDRAHTDSTWMSLVYRAIAALEDDTKVPVLEEIYGLLRREENANLRDLYWTIRPMEGPNALRLRKQMRNDVGMDNLR